MITLQEFNAEIPSTPFECIAVASPCKCIVAALYANIPSLELSWNTQLLNVAEFKLPYTTAPSLLLANSQRVATTVEAEKESGINNANCVQQYHTFHLNELQWLLRINVL